MQPVIAIGEGQSSMQQRCIWITTDICSTLIVVGGHQCGILKNAYIAILLHLQCTSETLVVSKLYRGEKGEAINISMTWQEVAERSVLCSRLKESSLHPFGNTTLEDWLV